MLRPILTALVLSLLGQVSALASEPDTVPDFELERYLGRWYQIALFPNRFQKKCRGETRAEYARVDGKLQVSNFCADAAGKTMQVVGEARLNRDYNDPARLEVRFAPAWLGWLDVVWGDYWVLAIDEAYTAVIVGSPDRDYLWILARTNQLSRASYQQLLDVATSQGYDLSRLELEPGVLITEAVTP